MKPLLVTLLTLACAQTPGASQARPSGTFESFVIASTALGEERRVDVRLPRGYRESEEKMPVLLLLDGESLFPPAAGIATFMANLLEVPRMIVVGIPNQARTRDLTPAPVDGWVPPMPPDDNGVGGASRFLRFVADELLADIRSRYRAAPFVTIVGHSLGGTFVAYALAERPDAFGAGLTLDPSLWWNERAHIGPLVTTLRESPAASLMRLVSVEFAGGFREDWATLERASRADVFGKHIAIDSGESHGSMPIVGLREGLRALFADYPPQPPAPGQGAVAALTEQYELVSERFGYEVPIPVGALNRAGRMAIDANRFAEARVASSELRSRGRADLADAIDTRITAEGERGSANFISLAIPTRRPAPEALAPFVGRWTGTIDQETGVDSELTLDIVAAADSVVLHMAQRYPRGRIMKPKATLIDVKADGTLEFGVRMRGGVGMEVWVARLASGGTRLVGSLEFRGIRIPEGVTPPKASLDLGRDPAR